MGEGMKGKVRVVRIEQATKEGGVEIGEGRVRREEGEGIVRRGEGEGLRGEGKSESG